MKNNPSISFAVFAVTGIVFLASCTVQHRARHPRPARHPRVIKVGMEKPAIPVDSATAGFTWQTGAIMPQIIDGIKTK